MADLRDSFLRDRGLNNTDLNEDGMLISIEELEDGWQVELAVRFLSFRGKVKK